MWPPRPAGQERALGCSTLPQTSGTHTPGACCELTRCFFLFFSLLFLLKILFVYLERGEGRNKERERKINVREKHRSIMPQLRAWSTTQACTLTGNQTSYLLLPESTLNQQSHTGQGSPGAVLHTHGVLCRPACCASTASVSRGCLQFRTPSWLAD